MTTKQQIIRPGQCKPYVKATRKQIERRIEGAALFLACRLHKSEIYRVFREYFGVESRQAARYMAQARARTGAQRDSFSLADRRQLIMNGLITNDLRFIGPVRRRRRRRGLLWSKSRGGLDKVGGKRGLLPPLLVM